jgi:hypothetical protein
MKEKGEVGMAFAGIYNPRSSPVPTPALVGKKDCFQISVYVVQDYNITLYKNNEIRIKFKSVLSVLNVINHGVSGISIITNCV